MRATKTEVATSIAGIQIGSRNLLVNSEKEVGVTATREFVQFADIAPIFDKYGLIEYTISFDIKSADISQQSGVQVYCQNGSGAKYDIGSKWVEITEEYTRKSVTVTPKIQDSSLTQSFLAFYGIYNTGNIPIVKNVKIEKGNKATDWTAAPEDTQLQIDAVSQRVTNAETRITQNADAITLRATKQEVENLQIGGRNLWLNTKEYDPSAYEGWVDNNDGTTRYVTAAPYTNIDGFGVQRIAMAWGDASQRVPIEPNVDYTLSAWIKWESEIGQLYFFCDGSSVEQVEIQGLNATEYKRIAVTFNSGNLNVSTCRFEATTNAAYLIYGIKLEKGNKATDWTPAIEDVDLAVNNAQSTADESLSKIVASESVIQQLSDSISMLVGTDANGASLVTQTADGWVFATGEIKTTAEKARDDLAELTAKFGSTDSVVSFLKTSVDDMSKKTDYVNIGTYNNEPCIELGASDSKYKVLITNTQILFQVGSAAPTRIDADGLVSENVTVENELRQKNEDVSGYYAWAVRANGNYGLTWYK